MKLTKLQKLTKIPRLTKTQQKIYRNYNTKVKNYRTSIIEDSASLEVQLEWIL